MSSRKKSRRPSFKGSLNPSKRHRDRVNVELDNLAKLLPFPPEVITKLDKLSVLRLSASYLRTKSFFKGLRSTDETGGSSSDAPRLDNIEKNGKLRDMMLEALDGFLMVLTQEGELFYASETISDYLGVSQANVIHQDFLRLVHVDDHKILLNNLQLVPSPPEKKIVDITDDDAEQATGDDDDEAKDEGSEVGRERSFVCRFKCILNTNAGFYKPFQCHGRLRELDQPEVDAPQLALFLMCSPVEISTSILEVRMKSMLFSTKNNLDLTFVDIDQKGKQIVGYTKKDILAQSSYCMMHYDDIPILKKMHQDLIETGKCEGTFRWLNKQTKWQWLTGSGQVILKNNQPDFVITTNKPLSDEEGEEEIRRRERELGIVPTSPATMLTHLQIAPSPSPSLHASFDEGAIMDKPQSLLTTDVSASLGGCSSLSSTSCASDVLSPDVLPWDFDADTLFEATGTTWDSAHASLADLDEIGKADLVGDLFHLDVNDFNFDEGVGHTQPLNPGPSCAIQEFPPTITQPVSHSTAPAWSPSQQNSVAVSSSDQHQFPAPSFAATGLPPATTAYLVNVLSPNGMSSVNHQQNGMTSMATTMSAGYLLNHAGMINRPNPSMRATSAAHQVPAGQEPFAPGPMPQLGQSLLRVQTQDKPLNHPPIKTEPGQSVGYYCSAADPMPDISRMAASGVPFYGHSAQVNTGNRYQNRYVNQGNFPACAPAPPSPYSSGSSSSSSYADALSVQFSPTELLTSPFSSPRGDNDYIHNNFSATAGPSPAGQYYHPVNNNYRTVHRPRVPNTFSEQFVNIPEISPMGVVEELVPGARHVSPIAAHNAGMANW